MERLVNIFCLYAEFKPMISLAKTGDGGKRRYPKRQSTTTIRTQKAPKVGKTTRSLPGPYFYYEVAKQQAETTVDS